MPESRSPPRWRIALAFAAIYLIWGSTYLAMRIAIRTLPPFTMAGIRFGTAGAILYGGSRLRGDPRPEPFHWKSAVLIGALMLLVGNGGVVWAEQRVPSGLASLLAATLSFWMVLLDWARPGGVRPAAGVVAGLLLGFTGVALLVGPGRMGGGVDPLGACAVLLGSISWATGSLYSRGAKLPASPLLATGMEMLAGGGLMLAAGAFTGEWPRIHPAAISLSSALAVAYLVVMGSLVAFNAYIWLLKVSSPSKIATYAYVNPVIAVLLGWSLAGEALTSRMLLAAAVILAAVGITVGCRPKPGVSEEWKDAAPLVASSEEDPPRRVSADR